MTSGSLLSLITSSCSTLIFFFPYNLSRKRRGCVCGGGRKHQRCTGAPHMAGIKRKHKQPPMSEGGAQLGEALDGAATSKPRWDERTGWSRGGGAGCGPAEHEDRTNNERSHLDQSPLLQIFLCQKKRRLDAGVSNDASQSRGRQAARGYITGWKTPTAPREAHWVLFTATIAADVFIGRSHGG